MVIFTLPSLGAGGPVLIMRSTAVSFSAWLPGDRDWLMMLPACTVVLCCSVTLPSLSSALVISILATSSVFPVRGGTVTSDCLSPDSSGPRLTTMLTEEPGSTTEPASGSWDITKPFGTVSLFSPRTSPSL